MKHLYTMPGTSGRATHAAADLGIVTPLPTTDAKRSEFFGDNADELVSSMRENLDWFKQSKGNSAYMEDVARRVGVVRDATVRTDSALNFLTDLEEANVILLWQEGDHE